MLKPVALVRKAKGAYYGWWVLSATFILGVLSGGIFSHSNAIFFGPIKRDLGLSSAQTSLIFSLARAEGSFAGPIVGWLVDKFGSRPLIMAGGVLARLKINEVWALLSPRSRLMGPKKMALLWEKMPPERTPRINVADSTHQP